MIRLHFVVEGQTEEEFVNSVLADHLGEFDISADARCVETSRNRRRLHRGGLRYYEKAKRDLILWMKEDQNADAYFRTMFDLYALPHDFPRYAEGGLLTNPYHRISFLEQAFAADINHRRFVPYVQLHEFEALILSDPLKLDCEFLEHDTPIRRLVEMCARYDSPELIDDGPGTSSSKRIIAEIPDYEGRKVSAAPRIAAKIGLNVIRQNCPHFDAWLRKLEALGT